MQPNQIAKLRFWTSIKRANHYSKYGRENLGWFSFNFSRFYNFGYRRRRIESSHRVGCAFLLVVVAILFHAEFGQSVRCTPLYNITPLEYIENIIRQTIKKVGHSDLLEEIGKDTKLLIIVNPKRKFSVDQFDHLKHLVESGTSILILLNEEGEKASKSNINYFLEEYGMAVNSDVVIRTSFVQVIFIQNIQLFNNC